MISRNFHHLFNSRWLKTVPASETSGGVGSTMSLLILHQLEDKQTALEVYISFLKEVGLWKRVSFLKACVKLTAKFSWNKFQPFVP